MKAFRFPLLVFVAAVAMYAGTLDHYFVSDDFLNLERNGFRTIGEGLSLFSTTDTDFYRPIPRLHFGIVQGIFSDRVFAWNVIGLLLHAIASVLAYGLARDFLGPDRREAARWAGVLFAVHFIHVDVVLWASGVTGSWMAMFLFAALLLHRRSRRTRHPRDLALSVAAFAGALLSKETAVTFVPLWLLTLAWWPGRDRARRVFPRYPSVVEAAPFALLLGAYALIVIGIDRGGDASPYRWIPGAHLLKNAAFFAFGGFLPIRYWELQAVWTESGGLLPFASAVLSKPHLGLPLAVGGLGLLLVSVRGDRDVRGGLLWILAASLPFLLLPGSGERFQYVSSFGACVVLGVLLQRASQRLGRRRRIPGGLAIGGLVILLFAAGNLDRQQDWKLASRWTKSIVARWDYLRVRDASERIDFVGIPGAHRSAWVFRNGFDSMVRLFWQGRPYWREEDRPGAEADLKMFVELGESGSVAMLPEPVVAPAGPEAPVRPGEP